MGGVSILYLSFSKEHGTFLSMFSFDFLFLC